MPPADPLNFAAVAGSLPLTGLAASSGPVRRAMGIDPNVILREESVRPTRARYGRWAYAKYCSFLAPLPGA